MFWQEGGGEQGEHQNSIIWSFFHKLFHSCSNSLEQTFGRGWNAKPSCQMKCLVTGYVAELLIKCCAKNVEKIRRALVNKCENMIENGDNFMLLLQFQPLSPNLLTHGQNYCQQYKNRSWMFNDIIQYKISLLSPIETRKKNRIKLSFSSFSSVGSRQQQSQLMSH